MIRRAGCFDAFTHSKSSLHSKKRWRSHSLENHRFSVSTKVQATFYCGCPSDASAVAKRCATPAAIRSKLFDCAS